MFCCNVLYMPILCIIYYCCYWLLLTVPTLVSIAVQEGSNQFNQGVGNAAGGQKQWEDDGEDSPSPTGVCLSVYMHVSVSVCARVYVYHFMSLVNWLESKQMDLLLT